MSFSVSFWIFCTGFFSLCFGFPSGPDNVYDTTDTTFLTNLVCVFSLFFPYLSGNDFPIIIAGLFSLSMGAL